MPRRLCEIIDDGERKAMLTLLGYEVSRCPVRLADWQGNGDVALQTGKAQS
jgi:hypothetical protein